MTAWVSHLRASLAELSVYDTPPSEGMIALHANECTVAWPAHVLDDLANTLRTIDLCRYPDPLGRPLRHTLAALHNVSADRIVIGNGSDEIIALLLTALSGGPRPTVVVPGPTFVMYRHTARVLGMAVREVALTSTFQLDEAGLRAALPGATVAFFARPNNPTGALWDAHTLVSLVRAHPSTVFVVDEAYIAYAPGESLLGQLQGDNVVFMRTLSKTGLAALRLGYCIAPPGLCAQLDRVRHPYNVSQTSLALAKAVLERHHDVLLAMVRTVIDNRAALQALLRRMRGAIVHDSGANFVLTRLPPGLAPAELCRHLHTRSILIKDVSAHPLLQGCVRVGVGTQPQLQALEAALSGLPEKWLD